MDNKSQPRVNRQSRFSETFRLKVVADIEYSKMTYNDASLKYGVNKGVIFRWYKQYLPILVERGVSMKKTSKNKLDKKNPNSYQNGLCDLSSELDHAKMKIEALELMISLAEEDYKINIRKKFGAKQ